MVMKKEEKKRNVRYSEGLVDDLCNFSRSDSRKRRGLWPGNKFPSFNLNQHVPQRNELRVKLVRRRQAAWAVPRAGSTCSETVGSMGRARVVQLLLEQETQRNSNIFPPGANCSKTIFRRTICTPLLKLRASVWVSLRGSMLACPTRKACHKGMSFVCSQTDGGRQYGSCPVRGVQ